MQPEGYAKRFYRTWQHPGDLVSVQVRRRESDLHLFYQPVSESEREQVNMAEEARSALDDCYHQLDKTIAVWPDFQTSLYPLRPPGWFGEKNYTMIADMLKAAAMAGVGPMAAVAGAVAERVGRILLQYAPQIIVENGGDLFVASTRERIMLVYAGEDSPFGDKIRVRLPAADALGVCTSSGRIGHSRSFGRADAALVMARSSAVADAFATALGNMVRHEDDLENTVTFARSKEQILGGLIMVGRRIALWGDVELS